MNYTYILRCKDDTLYCGWTNRLTQRLAAHNSGTGAKYTRNRNPVVLAYAEVHATKSDAMKCEAAIKKRTRAQKEALIASLPTGEYLTIYDAQNRPCGALARDTVHALGLRHSVCHLWVLGNLRGHDGIWLQQHAASRPLYPLFYDLAATGHIAHSESPACAVLRKAQEEIGLSLTRTQIQSIGTVEHVQQTPTYFDDQVAHIFVHHTFDVPQFQTGEAVARMVFLPLSSYTDALKGRKTVPAYGVDSAEFALSSATLCCLHAKEWEQLQSGLSEHT